MNPTTVKITCINRIPGSGKIAVLKKGGQHFLMTGSLHPHESLHDALRRIWKANTSLDLPDSWDYRYKNIGNTICVFFLRKETFLRIGGSFNTRPHDFVWRPMVFNSKDVIRYSFPKDSNGRFALKSEDYHLLWDSRIKTFIRESLGV